MQADYIWMNGQMVPFNEANIHFLSPTIHYGLGAFEGIRCYKTSKGPAIFRLDEHLQRLLDSALILGINNFEYSLEELRQATFEVIKANKFTECYIRPLIYLEGPLGLDLDVSTPKIGISTWEWGTYLGDEALESGVNMMISSFTRHHINVSMTKAKISGNYVNSVLAKTLALRSGYDEAIMLDPDGYVSECSGENLFIVNSQNIQTPPKATILEGITRDSIITIAKDSGFKISENMISRDQIYIADELFVCGTAAEVTPVRSVDHRTIGAGKPGTVTKNIQQTFFDTVNGNGKRSQEWLSHI
ncbi:MAG TPA: branched chain amino acid aminotransferase [Chloroflexi bacterium]|nr:branched chain amino acid aminotransferase [Chloroflexota bacterium]HCU99507.1 branched chain amino acid aminotransferase [Chloroflexota bacterium]|tara:strand:- start:12202 stop:13110 length:909 start_codon:yes stop_codon:yes gene_type:complete